MTDIGGYTGTYYYSLARDSSLYTVALKKLQDLHGYGIKSGKPITHKALSTQNIAHLETWKTNTKQSLDGAAQKAFGEAFKRFDAAFKAVRFYWKHATRDENSVELIMEAGSILSGQVVRERATLDTGYANTSQNEANTRGDTGFVYFRVETHADAMKTGFGETFQFVVDTALNSGWMADSWITLRDMLFPYGAEGKGEVSAGLFKQAGGYRRDTLVDPDGQPSLNALATEAVFTHYLTKFQSSGIHETETLRVESVFEGAFYGQADILKGIMLSLFRAMYEIPPLWQAVLDADDAALPGIIEQNLPKFFHIEGKVPVSLKVGSPVALKEKKKQNAYKFDKGVSLPGWPGTRAPSSTPSEASRASSSSKGPTSPKTSKKSAPKYAGSYARNPATSAATGVGGGGLQDTSPRTSVSGDAAYTEEELAIYNDIYRDG